MRPFLDHGIRSVPVGKDPVELVAEYAMTGPDEEQAVDLAALLPYDEGVVEADRAGACILDRKPDAPSVQAVYQLSELLAPGRIGAGHPPGEPVART